MAMESLTYMCLYFVIVWNVWTADFKIILDVVKLVAWNGHAMGYVYIVIFLRISRMYFIDLLPVSTLNLFRVCL